MQKKIVVVPAAGHGFLEPGVIEGRDRLADFLVERKQLVLRLLPCFWTCIYNRRKVLLWRPTLWHWSSLHRAQASVIPHADMGDELPNGVHSCYWMGSSMLGVNTREQVAQTRSMPRFSFISAAQLVGNAETFCVHSSWFSAILIVLSFRAPGFARGICCFSTSKKADSSLRFGMKTLLGIAVPH